MNLNNKAQKSISNCPLTGTARRVTIYRQIHDAKARTFELFCEVEYLNSEGEVIKSPPFLPVVKAFTVSDKYMVNENGIVSPDGVISEYNFYVNAINENLSGGYFGLQNAAIPVLDNNKRFD